MESATVNILISALVGFAAGAVVIFFVVRQIYRRSSLKMERDRLRDERDQLRAEFDDYRQRVRVHFTDTAELLNEINESQKRLYKAVAADVGDLCDVGEGQPEMLQQHLRALAHGEKDPDADLSSDPAARRDRDPSI